VYRFCRGFDEVLFIRYCQAMSGRPRIRIGELSRRVGVSPELLRAWETRYGLLSPERTAGGLRLFSEEDVKRVQSMCAHIAAGIPASEAARLANFDERSGRAGDEHAAEEIEEQLGRAVLALDDGLAQSALDRLFAALPLQRAMAEVILPFLSRVGESWAASRMSVAQEHFASNVIGARLRGLTSGWGVGVGPRAILACPSGERHDLGLLCFGLALHEHGWRITYLGADTPLVDVAASLDELEPTIVVLCATSPEPLRDAREEIAALRSSTRVAAGGAGATWALAEELDLEYLGGDPIAEAGTLKP
jgi:DNA-binding transcriptional MerR regulator/methylmalonyl-CoA mutase cobalamin-binding subunit